MDRPEYACPKCRNTKLTELAAKSSKCFSSGADGSQAPYVQTTYVLQCPCGVVLTRIVRRGVGKFLTGA
jgi:ribosomal protein L37AE/L43A